jgi:GNAT superfamily N-acetyltransferase
MGHYHRSLVLSAEFSRFVWRRQSANGQHFYRDFAAARWNNAAMPQFTIRSARFSADTPAIRELVGEYIASIDVNACRDEVESGLRKLPAPYDAPRNGYLLAECGESVAGGVAFAGLDGTGLDGGDAEMARLYVRPAFRRDGIARALVSRVMAEAAAAGYRRMVLHTLPDWRAARALYGALEFAPIRAYAGVAVAKACQVRLRSPATLYLF